MKLVIRRRVWMACAGLLVVGLVIIVADSGAERWDRLRAEQEQSQVKLARLQGWIASAPEISAAHEALIGADGARRGFALGDLSQQASAAGVHLTELKPRAQEIELSLEGSAQGISAYLQGLLARKPPLRLESVGLASQPKTGAPILLRLRVRSPEAGGQPS